MDRSLLVFIILAVLCWGVVIFGFSVIHTDPIEAVDDEAWACTALDKAELKGINATLENRYAAALQVMPNKKTKAHFDENGFFGCFPYESYCQRQPPYDVLCHHTV